MDLRDNEDAYVVLPVEIHKLILQVVVLQPDRQLWLACALTCREWLRFVAPRMFHTITLRKSFDIERIVSLQEEYQSSYIRLYARRVYLQVDAAAQESARTQPVTTALPLRLLSQHFTSLLVLHITTHEFLRGLLDLKNSQLPIVRKASYKDFARFSSLTTLSFQEHVFHSFTDFIRICGSLHMLEEVHLSDVLWQTIPQRPHAIIRSHDALHHRLRQVTAARTTVWPLAWLWMYYRGAWNEGLTLDAEHLFTAGRVAEEFCQSLIHHFAECKYSVDKTNRGGE